MTKSPLKSKNRRLHTHPLVLAILALALGQLIYKALLPGYLIDYPAYTGAVQAWLEGANPYTASGSSFSGQVNFLYPPGSLWLFLPLSLFPDRPGQILFTLLSVITAATAFFVALKQIQPLMSGATKVIVLALFLQTFPVKFNLTLGQINLIAMALTVFSLHWLHRKPVLASLLLAGAINLKLFPVIILLWLVKNRHWRVIVITLSLVLLTNVSSGWLPQFLNTFGKHLQTPVVMHADPYQISPNVLIYHLTGWAPPFNLSWLVLIPITASLYIAKGKQPLTTAYGLLALSVVLPTNTWIHHTVFMYPLLLQPTKNPIYTMLLWLLLAFHIKNPQNTNPFHLQVLALQYGLLYGLSLKLTLKSL